MSTRAEQVEACRACWDSEVRDAKQWARVLMNVKDAAATLTSDGELRERLKKLVEEWRSSSQLLTEKDCADEIEALLKETSDEG